jgi:hypothetical protein
MLKKDWSNYRIIVILPFLAIAIIYATESLTRGAFFVCNGGNCTESIPANIWKVLKVDSQVNVSSSTDPQAIAAQEIDARRITALKYGGRMTWYMLGEIYLFVCIAALVVTSIVTYQLFPQHPFFWILVAIISSFVVGVFLYANPALHMRVFLVIFEKAITEDVPAIAQITNFLNSLGNAAAVSLLFATCATLLPSEETYPEGMKQLSKRMKYLRFILYSGTLLLVVTILLKKAIFQWSLAYTSQEEGVAEIGRNFVSVLLSMDGAFYTLILAAIYIPAALVLQRRARLLADLSVDETEKEMKLKEYGLTFSFAESVPRIIAILGPLLIGPVGELLNSALLKF